MPERGPGLRDGGDHHAGRREPRPHRRRSPRRSTRSSRRLPALKTARRSPATACSTAASRPTPATFFVTLKDFEERYAPSRRRKARERARRADRAATARRRQHQGGRRHPDRAAGHPGHRHHGRLRVLDPGHRRRRPGAARRADPAVPRQGAHAAGADRPEHHLPRQHAAAAAPMSTATRPTLLGVPVQDVYSAIQAQFGSLTVSQYNQYSRVWWVILQSDAAVPAEPRRPHAPLHAVEQRRDGPAVGAGHDRVGDRARPAAALQRLPGGQDQRQRRAGLQLRARRSRRWRRWRGRSCRRATPSRGRAWPSRRRSPGAPRRLPSSSA
ncbi:MAG: hypothetical protein MZU95_12070 [Desulfomicrobium escambiense]|nr:hypothetical protein [Desulfomicrobium escambiense]